jgi:hypothetical protein
MDRHRTSCWVAFHFLLLVFSMTSCKRAAEAIKRAPEGPAAFRTSQRATMAVDHFNVLMTRTTPMGEFKTTQALDCNAPYFFEHEVNERSQKAIDEGGSLSQGRPSAHQEHDTLFVDGKTYARNTSSWENASQNDDAHPDWFVSSRPREPKEACASIRQGTEFGYVPYAKMLQTNSVQYLGKQSVNGHDCFEYEAAFPGQKYSEQMTTVNEGGGNYSSFRPMVNTTFRSKVCLGVEDHLPYRVTAEDYTATYDYADVVKLPAPN